jgi:DNA-binding winged helix-turn-helix (wHTH) protein/predicted ATPase
MGVGGKAGVVYEFGPFRLDPRERRLLREGQPITLRAKIFETLCVLVEAHGHLVHKDELISRVWPDAVVEEGNLAHNISALRKALGEPVTGQKYIETVPGRGYRFVAAVQEVQHRESGTRLESCLPPGKPVVPHLVQRRKELQLLDHCLDSALGGKRQVVFVSGEAGIGKTALVDAFAAQARGKAELRFGYGQCLDHHGPGEAYLPVLEALSRMCREPAGEDLIRFLARCAPTWLVQMPWLLSGDEFEGLQRMVLGATRDRMLREMVESVEVLTAGRPLLLVLEDLHWADYSTVDLIARLARRHEAARLLVIGTYRPCDAELRGHPLCVLIQELVARGVCEELPLTFLDEGGVEEYLSSRFGQGEIPPGLAHVLHSRTEGNPLFLINVVDHWLPMGLLDRPPEELSLDVPGTLRGLIDQQLAVISSGEQAILEAASVAGREFAAAAVAFAIERTEDEVEEGCDALARQGLFLNPCGQADWPDGTDSACYSFVHDLHREILYDRIPPRRRARLHTRIGARVEAGYGVQARELAAELAVHFVEGQEVPRAVQYLRYASEQAVARSAYREALELIRQALGLLGRLPQSVERAEHELALHEALAPALMAVQGWGSPEVQIAYQRAKELCEQLKDQSRHAAVQVGLAAVLEVRGDYRQSQVLLEEYLHEAPNNRSGSLLVESHDLLACSLFHQGSFGGSVEHASRALSIYHPERCYPFFASSGVNPAVSAETWAALSLWFLGFPDQALEKATEAVRRAQDHVYSLASAQTQAGFLHQYRREPEMASEWADAAIDVATRNGFPYWAAVGGVLRGWGLAVQGQSAEGIAEIQRGLAGCRAAGVEMDRPYYLALLAEALCCDARLKDALCALDEALGMISNTRTFFYEAELHRLRGSVLMAVHKSRLTDVESSYQQALEVARGQEALCLELRAAASLARLWRDQGRQNEARDLLAEIYGRFTEGFGTADLAEANEILKGEKRGRSRLSKLGWVGRLVVAVAPASWVIQAADAWFNT